MGYWAYEYDIRVRAMLDVLDEDDPTVFVTVEIVRSVDTLGGAEYRLVWMDRG